MWARPIAYIEFHTNVEFFGAELNMITSVELSNLRFSMNPCSKITLKMEFLKL